MKPRNRLPPRPGAKLQPRQVPLAIGWYSEAEWRQVKAAATDAERFEQTFQAWETMAERALNDLRAQGHPIGKDSVHAMVSHLQDAFLFTAVPVATESLRRQNSNPRKIYPVDHGLIAAFDPSGKSNLGHHLEVVVHTELRRRRADVTYVRNDDGTEVDFLARRPGEEEELIQVCADVADPATLERELRALQAAHPNNATARKLLLSLQTQRNAKPSAK